MNSNGHDELGKDETQFLIHDTVDGHSIQQRKLILTGEINEGAAAYITMHLQLFAQSDDPAYIYICSPGGDVSSGYSIIDQIQFSPFPVYTIVRGQANSMGAVVAAYGTKGCRYITPNSTMMIHPISVSSVSESIEYHERAIGHYSDFYKSKMKDLATRTKLSYKKLIEVMSQTKWMTAKQAIKAGLVDNMWTKRQETETNRGPKIEK